MKFHTNSINHKQGSKRTYNNINQVSQTQPKQTLNHKTNIGNKPIIQTNSPNSAKNKYNKPTNL